MKIHWIVENFVGDNGYEELIEEIRKQGMKCTVLDITNHFNLKKGLVEKDDLVIFQGSIQLFKKLDKELDSYPIGWMTDSNYLCSKYYPYFQKYLFNDKHVFSTVSGLKHNKFWFYSVFGKEALIYVRPDGGDKTFTGQLIDLQDFDKFFSSDTRCSAKDTDLVVVSTPKNILGEWRFICTGEKEIIGVSCYQYQGQRTYIPSAPQEATKLCNEILSVGWYPDPFFTVDICQDADKNFWMMDMNSFTCAGMYGANKELIVKHISQRVMDKALVVKQVSNLVYNEGLLS